MHTTDRQPGEHLVDYKRRTRQMTRQEFKASRKRRRRLASLQRAAVKGMAQDAE